MGLFDKLRKPKLIKSKVYGTFPEFVSEEKLPDDFVTLQNMGRYYLINHDHSLRDYNKAFHIYNKIVQMDTQKQYMYTRRSLGDLYLNGKGIAKDPARGCALMNEWYQHIFLTTDQLFEIGLEMIGCITDGCMSWRQLMELAWQRMNMDYENYKEPLGAAMFVHLELFWKHRQLQVDNGWSNMEYCQYLYDHYKDPFAQFLLVYRSKDFRNRDERLDESAKNGCILATAYRMYLLNVPKDETEMRLRMQYGGWLEQQMSQLQQKAEYYQQMNLEEALQ